MATKAQIAVRVLQKLKVLENGETINTEDQTIVEDAYDASYALLDAQELTSWGSAEDIPTGAELPVIDYVANECKEAFSVPADLLARLPYQAEQSLGKLAILLAPTYVSDEIPADYF